MARIVRGIDEVKVGILAAKTGHGHISVAKALQSAFERQSIEAEVFLSFYEDLMLSNKIISDYYNFLMMTSPQLCYKFSELSYITRPDLSEDFYIGVEDKLKKFLRETSFDVIISTSHTINFALIRARKELNLQKKIKFYVVVTDPYIPISVGFDVKGADHYFCAMDSVKSYLMKNIEEERISVVPFPIQQKFFKEYEKDEITKIYKRLKLRKRKKIVVINSGSQGSFHSTEFLKAVLQNFPELQVIFVCGQNESLYQLAKLIVGKNKDRVRICQYVDNMNDILKISDLVVTKAGANSFFECVSMKKPMLVDCLKGFLYQEKGVANLLKEHQIGIIVDSIEHFVEAVTTLLDENCYQQYVQNLEEMDSANGADKIVEQILHA